ncbi:MAG: hypothetical protein WED07_15365 [Candidatus Freyarchaeum deiterrae]
MTESKTVNKLEKECIIEGQFDSPTAIGFIKAAITEIAKIYGPIFNRTVAGYALDFESRMLKENPPENIQGLEAVITYIVANLNRYPMGHCALTYGLLKSENRFEGGTGTRRAAYGAIKAILESTGMLKSLVGTTKNAYEALKALPVKQIKQVTRYHYIRNEEKNEVIPIYSNCPYKDSCLALVDEGISRIIGGFHCTLLNCALATVEIVTKEHFDYALEEFDKPDCRGRIFEA